MPLTKKYSLLKKILLIIMDSAGVCVCLGRQQTMESYLKEDIMPKGYLNRQTICWGISSALDYTSLLQASIFPVYCLYHRSPHPLFPSLSPFSFDPFASKITFDPCNKFPHMSQKCETLYF